MDFNFESMELFEMLILGTTMWVGLIMMSMPGRSPRLIGALMCGAVIARIIWHAGQPKLTVNVEVPVK